jgi:hypothetical protein
MRVPGARPALVLLLLAVVGATGEYVVVGPGSGVVGGGCDSAIVPANGAIGDCPDSLAHGEDCTPTCDDGYELVGRHSCTDGVLVEATCWPVDGDDVCDADAPVRGGGPGRPRILGLARVAGTRAVDAPERVG